MDSSNCLSYKRLIILHKLRCANCVTKILYFFHTTKLSVPVFSNFIFTRIFFLSRIIELSNFCLHTEYRGQSRIFFFSFLVPNFLIIVFQSHGISRTVTDFLYFLLVTNYRIFEFQSHGISRTVTDFSFFVTN